MLEDLFAGRGIDIAQKQDDLRQVSMAEGLPFGERKKTFNSRLAQELAKWAESEGQGDEFHAAVFRSYFVHGKNIGKTDTLVEIAESVNLSGKDAEAVLKTRAFKTDVDKDWARSRELGVTAVPTFVCNKQIVVGAQPYESLERLIGAR